MKLDESFNDLLISLFNLSNLSKYEQLTIGLSPLQNLVIVPLYRMIFNLTPNLISLMMIKFVLDSKVSYSEFRLSCPSLDLYIKYIIFSIYFSLIKVSPKMVIAYLSNINVNMLVHFF